MDRDFHLPQIPEVSREPIHSVLRILQLHPVAHHALEAGSLPQFREQLYGGQVLAQGLLAAAAIADCDRLPNSAHTYFMRAGKTTAPVTYQPVELRRGRSFETIEVKVFQGERQLATQSVSFQLPQQGPEFATSMPDVPRPQEVPSALEILKYDHPVGKFLGKTASFDMRHIPGHLYTGTRCAASPTQYVWLRPRAVIPTCDQIVQRALLTYVSDQFMLEPALRAQGMTWLTPGLALATLDHKMWYLRDVDINQWLLFVQRAISAQGGRSLTQASIFQEDGTLIAEAIQEGMIRSNNASSWSFERPPVP